MICGFFGSCPVIIATLYLSNDCAKSVKSAEVYNPETFVYWSVKTVPEQDLIELLSLFIVVWVEFLASMTLAYMTLASMTLASVTNIVPMVVGTIVGLVVVLLVIIRVATIINWRFVVCTSHILTC